MNHITITRTAQNLTVSNEAGELGFILRPNDWAKGYEAWANLQPKDGFARTAVKVFDTLRDAVTFITVEEAAL